jgi:NADH-quinone oxidoreductase E subunit
METNASQIINRFEPKRKNLIHIFHAVQEEYGYIPPEAITEVADFLGISENEIFGVLTFYKAFSLVPKGRNHITVCMGTACHVRGGAKLLEEMERKLGIAAGDTTADGEYSLDRVNCLGCCAIAPVVVKNEKYYSQMSVKKLDCILHESKSKPGKST